MRRAGLAVSVLLFALSLIAAPLSSESKKSSSSKKSRYPYLLLARVVGVHDGDTVTVLSGKKQYKVRLNGIDSPELKQAFGKKAKEKLSSMVFGRDVSIKVTGKDRYGRYLGDLALGALNVNQEMVRSGFAWHYKQYSADEALARLEREARSRKAGLWADPEPIPPWEFRHPSQK